MRRIFFRNDRHRDPVSGGQRSIDNSDAGNKTADCQFGRMYRSKVLTACETLAVPREIRECSPRINCTGEHWGPILIDPILREIDVNNQKPPSLNPKLVCVRLRHVEAGGDSLSDQHGPKLYSKRCRPEYRSAGDLSVSGNYPLRFGILHNANEIRIILSSGMGVY